MPIPKLTEEDIKKCTPLQERLVKRIYDYWRDFEEPLPYNVISGGYHSSAKKEGITISTLVDSIIALGYIERIPKKSGGTIILPKGVWSQLPIYKQDTWKIPTPGKKIRCADLDSMRKVRLLPSERDEPRYDTLGESSSLENSTASKNDMVPDKHTELPLEDQALRDRIKGILNNTGESIGLDATKEGNI
jgi:hypothetical protein